MYKIRHLAGFLLPFLCAGNLAASAADNNGTVKTDPAACAVKHQKAQELLKSGHPLEATALEEQAEELDPTNASVHRSLTALYVQMHRLNDALGEAETAVELAPKDANSHFNIATLFETMHNWPGAVSEYGKAISLGKDDLDSKRGLYECQAHTSEIRSAIAGLEKLSKENGQSKELWLALSTSYLLYRDCAGALTSVDKAVALDPTWPTALQLRAVVAFNCHSPAEARLYAQKLVEIDPRNVDAYVYLAKISCDGFFALDVAQWEAKQALLYQRNNSALLTILGENFAAPAKTLGKGQFTVKGSPWLQLAESVLQPAVAASPQNVKANYELAHVLYLQRKPWEALPYARKAYELNTSPRSKLLYLQCDSATNDLAGAFKRWLRGPS
jgi:tetratricopeptide (TPR) repeat protein